ncbi:MAG: hypothetical protein AAGC77_12315 [Pseudomonadota bacterium]
MALEPATLFAFPNGALLKDLAALENIDPSDAAKILKLAFLAPDVALAIARGHKAKTVSMETIKDLQNLPVSFAANRRLFGLAE